MKINSYIKAQKYLESFIPQETAVHKTSQLQRMRDFCQKLNSPEKNYPIIHITGTSGKGSTATFCSTILSKLSLKTGLHISPHLQSLTERVQINNKNIPLRQFLNLLNSVIPVIEDMKINYEYGAPTYFEILTAMAFLNFSQNRTDAAVIEVGLGGTLDATNIIPNSTVIITNISLDHTNILGRTVKRICQDKIGIIKPASPGVVCGITQPILRNLVINKCQNLQVPLKLINRDFSLDYTTLELKGEFQHQNFTLAKQATEIFVRKYFPKLLNKLPLAIKSAAKTTFIPGRLETVSTNPLIILDGAHNTSKVKALIRAIQLLYPHQKWLVVLAVKKGKNYATIIKHLNDIAVSYVFTKFTNTTDSGTNYSTNPKIFRNYTLADFIIEENSLTAVGIAQKISQTKDLPILITGSLYLVGEVRDIWYPEVKTL